jgi:hypothetical protein
MKKKYSKSVLKIVKDAMAHAEKLKAQGWTREDFIESLTMGYEHSLEMEKRIAKEKRPMKARFQADSGCYKCEICRKKTRAVGDNEAELKLCKSCYDRETEANSICDAGSEAERQKLEAAFVKKWKVASDKRFKYGNGL